MLGVFYNTYLLCYVYGGIYTIMAHAMTFSNLGGVSLLLYKLATKQKIHWLEPTGLAIALTGCFVIIRDPRAAKEEGLP